MIAILLPAAQSLALFCTAIFAGAAIYITLVVPFTLIVIKRTNDKLLAPGRDLAPADTRALLERWGRLHAVRSLLSVLAALIMLWEVSSV